MPHVSLFSILGNMFSFFLAESLERRLETVSISLTVALALVFRFLLLFFFIGFRGFHYVFLAYLLTFDNSLRQAKRPALTLWNFCVKSTDRHLLCIHPPIFTHVTQHIQWILHCANVFSRCSFLCILPGKMVNRCSN